jgi:hypothetical protein
VRRRQDVEARFAAARKLNDEAIASAAARRFDDATDLSRKAVDLYRELAVANAARFRWYLATALIGYSTHAAAAGYANSSLSAVAEGATILGHLYDEDPERYRLDVIQALRSFALRLADAGRTNRALTAISTAHKLLRPENPDELPQSCELDYSSARLLLEAGKNDLAVRHASEAATGYATLAAFNDRFTERHARALLLLARSLNALGQHETALTSAEEAVRSYRRLAGAQPDHYASDLINAEQLYAACFVAAEGPFEARDVVRNVVRVLA